MADQTEHIPSTNGGSQGRGRPLKPSSGQRRKRLLDAAEDLFSRHGFDGVTLRKIAAQAGVDVALGSYHFGSKQGLFDAVLLRRAEILNKVRLDALARFEKLSPDGRASVSEIIEAYLRPLLVQPLTGDKDGWQRYLALVAQVNNSPEWGRLLMSKFFDPLAQRFVDALLRAMPGSAAVDAYWCYHFLSGALTLTFAQTGRIDHLSGNLCQSTDMAAAYQRMLPFFVAGFESVCQPASGGSGRNA